MWFIFHQQEVSFRIIVLLKHKVKWWKMSSIWILLWFLPLCLLYWNTEYTFKHNTLMPYNMVYFVFEVQYTCHISDIFVTDFQTYDLSF
jgi:hypothetical protein